MSPAALVLPALLACSFLAQEPEPDAPDAEPTRAKMPIRAPDPGFAEGEDIDAILGGALELGDRTISPEEKTRMLKRPPVSAETRSAISSAPP